MATTIDQILSDVLQEKGSLVRGQEAEKGDYQQVWDAFNRYVTAILSKRMTLDVPSFCKIGWRVDHLQGKVKLRPHFQLTDSFLRVHELDTNHHPTLPDTQLSPISEFNYSKAAIKYSQGLTKATMFVGLRAIVQKIGEACRRQQVAIDFEMGQLLCNERIAHFAFVGELYRQEGLEIPTGALVDVKYRPSRTFAPATAEGLALSVRGKSSGRAVPDSPRAARSQQEPPSPSRLVRKSCERTSADGVSQAVVTQESDTSRPDVADNADVLKAAVDDIDAAARQRVQRVALERHLEEVKADAAEVLQVRTRDKEFTKECESREAVVATGRRDFYGDHNEELKRQMRQLDEKRQAGRENAIVQASQHDFPCFGEVPKGDPREYIGERKRNLKEDLDQQVSQKHIERNALKQQDNEFSAKDAEQSKAIVQRRAAEETAKKEKERNVLSDAWELSIRLKQVQKAIDSHHLTGGKKDLPKLTADLRSQVPSLAMPEPRLGTGNSRLSTGSARRVPIGAAASLALRRDRQGPNSARK